MQTKETLMTHPHNTKLQADNINVDPVNTDSDCPHCWDLHVAHIYVLGLHHKGRVGLINMAVPGHGVGAVAQKAVVMVIKGLVEIAHDPAGARLWC